MPVPAEPPTPANSVNVRGREHAHGYDFGDANILAQPPSSNAEHDKLSSSLTNPSHSSFLLPSPAIQPQVSLTATTSSFLDLESSPKSILVHQNASVSPTVEPAKPRTSRQAEPKQRRLRKSTSSKAVKTTNTSASSILEATTSLSKPQKSPSHQFDALPKLEPCSKPPSTKYESQETLASQTARTKSKPAAAARRTARRTAHSVIERRRRSKMNEQFGILRDMIPDCRGLEMHKVAILQASIAHLRRVEACLSELQKAHSRVSTEHNIVDKVSSREASAQRNQESRPSAQHETHPSQDCSNCSVRVGTEVSGAKDYMHEPSGSTQTPPVVSASQQQRRKRTRIGGQPSKKRSSNAGVVTVKSETGQEDIQRISLHSCPSKNPKVSPFAMSVCNSVVERRIEERHGRRNFPAQGPQRLSPLQQDMPCQGEDVPFQSTVHCSNFMPTTADIASTPHRADHDAKYGQVEIDESCDHEATAALMMLNRERRHRNSIPEEAFISNPTASHLVPGGNRKNEDSPVMSQRLIEDSYSSEHIAYRSNNGRRGMSVGDLLAS